MIINNWYVAAESTEVGESPLPVRMLGCDLVLFRTIAGEVACLSAVCCHRGGDLSRGQRIGSCIQCPYHGWEYDQNGRCTKMPAPADRPALPDFLPMYADDSWRVVRLQRDWHANWARVHENLLDASHLFLVHSFGRHLPAKTTTARAETTVTLDFSIIGLMHRNNQQMSNGYDQIIWNCLTPVDADNTRNFGLHFRNSRKSLEHDATSGRGGRRRLKKRNVVDPGAFAQRLAVLLVRIGMITTLFASFSPDTTLAALPRITYLPPC